MPVYEHGWNSELPHLDEILPALVPYGLLDRSRRQLQRRKRNRHPDWHRAEGFRARVA